MRKSSGAKKTDWSHHDDMFINLRDWLDREVKSLRDSMTKEHPELLRDPSIVRSFKDAEGLTTRLFEMFDSMVTVAEVETNKKKKKLQNDAPTTN